MKLEKELVLVAPTRLEMAPVSGSRFIADLVSVASEEEVREARRQLVAEFPDASHVCSAWRIRTPHIERANDDGEPSGSAGRPMLAQLCGHGMVNVAAFVTRYFGGTKLGVGGLVRAYGGAVAGAIRFAELAPYCELVEFGVGHGYGDVSVVDRVVNAHGATIVEREFLATVSALVSCDKEMAQALCAALLEATSGRVQLDYEEV